MDYYKLAKHAVIAVGVGLATALVWIPDEGEINWRRVATKSAAALLGSLGISYAANKK